MIHHILTFAFKSTGYFLIGIPVTLIGLPIVALALPFRTQHLETAKPFTDARQIAGEWMLVTLPTWAKWWSNEFDGALGDKRGWWNTYCMDSYGKPCTSFRSMWQWLAIRNPANYYSRVVTGCDVSQCTITHLAGKELANSDNAGWSFLVATDDVTGEEFHYLSICFPWFFDRTHAVFGRFGWKIKMDQNGMLPTETLANRLQASVFRITPWKKL